MPVTDTRSSLLDDIDAKINAGHSLSRQEVETELQNLTTPQLERKLTLVQSVLSSNHVKQTEKLDDLKASAAMCEQELDRRRKNTSKMWLVQVGLSLLS